MVLGVVFVLLLGGLFVILRPDPPAAAPSEWPFDLRVDEDGTNPEEVLAREGDRVTLGIRSGRGIDLHLYGYDLERGVEPGGAAEISFVADLTGRFAMEDHETEEDVVALVAEPR